MDHDELLRWVTTERKIACDSYGMGKGKSPCGTCNLCVLGSMLIAVVKLHQPGARGECAVCSWIINGSVLYEVCPTIQAIEKELL